MGAALRLCHARNNTGRVVHEHRCRPADQRQAIAWYSGSSRWKTSAIKRPRIRAKNPRRLDRSVGLRRSKKSRLRSWICEITGNSSPPPSEPKQNEVEGPRACKWQLNRRSSCLLFLPPFGEDKNQTIQLKSHTHLHHAQTALNSPAVRRSFSVMTQLNAQINSVF